MEIKTEIKVVTYIEYDGIRFYPDQKGYWLAKINKKPKRLHTYVWEKFNGPVPEGFHVHHIDLNTNNNEIENLILLSEKEHLSLHGSFNKEKKAANIKKYALPKACEWHKSKKGSEWHKKQFQTTLAPKFKEMATLVCEVCGKEYQTSVLMQHKSRFCSNKCKAQHRRNSGVDNEIRVCSICNKPFSTNKYAKAKTCSKECRDISRKLNRKR